MVMLFGGIESTMTDLHSSQAQDVTERGLPLVGFLHSYLVFRLLSGDAFLCQPPSGVWLHGSQVLLTGEALVKRIGDMYLVVHFGRISTSIPQDDCCPSWMLL
jgi:hypothetical protein